MTQKQYAKLVQQISPNSPVGKDCLMAFLVGGLICLLGQFGTGAYDARFCYSTDYIHDSDSIPVSVCPCRPSLSPQNKRGTFSTDFCRRAIPEKQLQTGSTRTRAAIFKFWQHWEKSVWAH